MRTREDIESYLLRSGLPHKEVQEGMWIVHEADRSQNIVVRLAGPVIVFRLKVLELDRATKKPELFEKLLELNAGDMLHGAYGIADGAVVLSCSLRAENLDYNEFQGTIDDFALAFSNHYETLADFRGAA